MAKNSRQPGLFIVFEGGEGAGKSTQAKRLKDLLEATGQTVTITYEPGGTALGKELWAFISHRELDPLVELFLFATARAQHVTEVIKPALARGDVVICDRFIHSTLAYQGYGRGLPLNHVRTVNYIATQGLTPDIVFLIDVPIAVGLARQSQVGGDRIGSEGLAFHQRVHEGYLTIAKEEHERFYIIDGTLPEREVTERVWARVRSMLVPD